MRTEQLLHFGVTIGILYGIYNMLIPTTTGGTPNFPFPFQPSEFVWFGRIYLIDWLYDPWTRVFYDPAWLAWSLALYVSITLAALFIGRSILKKYHESF